MIEVFFSPEDAGVFAAGMAGLALIVVTGLVVASMRRSEDPVLGGKDEPSSVGTGWTPLASALLFGLGWGVAGYFPMAALISAGTFSSGAAIFLISVLVGMVLCDVMTGDGKAGRGRKGSFG